MVLADIYNYLLRYSVVQDVDIAVDVLLAKLNHDLAVSYVENMPDID
jgi:hypothetical protein